MIHPLAVVADSAIIGENVEIDQFSSIYEDVVIGKGTKIHPNVVIYPGTRIGEHCEIYPGAVIGAVPQDLKYHGEYTTTVIGNHTVIRECVTIHRGTDDRKVTSVGDHCLIMGYVHIAHDCVVGNHVILANYTGLSGHNTIEDYAILEGKVGTQQFICVGAHAFVAGATLIRKNVPPYIRVAREPITYAGVNAIGLRRRGMTDNQIRTIEDIYRLLFVQSNNITNGINAIMEEIPDCEEKTKVLEFIAASDKGIVRGPL
jgi:UDP-N-acetylglucosamine acyltransferase